MLSSVDRHFDCFHVLGIVNSVGMNIRMYASFQIWFSLDIYLKVALLDHMVVLFLVL